jgi:alanine racemase
MKGLRTWIEIHQAHLKHNVEVFRSHLTKDVKIMAVVKSNAYGHGLTELSKHLESLGVDWLGVDSVVEGFKLRKEGINLPILVLGYTLAERVQEALDADLTLTISSLDTIERWQKLGLDKKIKIHIKVDTGLHRQGFLLDAQQALITKLKDNTAFNVSGLYTHFAKAKNPDSREYTAKQHQEFQSWISLFQENGFTPITHASASAGSLLYVENHFDMVRVGAGLYGMWPSLETRLFLDKKITLLPVLSWKTIVVEKKELPKGSGVGYDLSEVLNRDSAIAICPIGYWHGFPRSLSSVGEVLLHGKRARVLGRVAMDMIIIDITDIAETHLLDEVTLIGKDGSDEITAEEMAERAGTSAYEILTRLNPLIKKIYII